MLQVWYSFWHSSLPTNSGVRYPRHLWIARYTHTLTYFEELVLFIHYHNYYIILHVTFIYFNGFPYYTVSYYNYNSVWFYYIGIHMYMSMTPPSNTEPRLIILYIYVYMAKLNSTQSGLMYMSMVQPGNTD